jgi:hypothetical protein
MHSLLKAMEAHAALTQAIAAVGSVMIAAAALTYAVWTLKALSSCVRNPCLMLRLIRPVALLGVAAIVAVAQPTTPPATYERRSKNRPQNAAGAALCGGVKVVHRGILVS